MEVKPGQIRFVPSAEIRIKIAQIKEEQAFCESLDQIKCCFKADLQQVLAQSYPVDTSINQQLWKH
jgi:hypothetical protein